MRTNTSKAKLANGEVVFGAIISRYAPDLVELMGAIGYDFVMIDCEHGPMNLDQVEHMVRAAEGFGITPIARVPDHADATILRFLDRGLQGVIVPHINTGGEEIEATHYRLKSDITVDLWYDDQGRWVKLGFEARGQQIDYVLKDLY